MDKYVYVFHHTDLDGMGVKILGMLHAMELGLPCKTFSSSYKKVNTYVCDSIKTVDDVAEIIIGDISVNEETAERLDEVYKLGVPVRLRDHHDTATWLNKYEWALVSEKDDDEVYRCGTWWLAQDPDMQVIANKFHGVIEAIDDWDTWKWKEHNLTMAKQLNSLFNVMGEEEFTQYMIEGYKAIVPIEGANKMFTEKAKIMIDTYDRHIQAQVAVCEKFMYTMNLWAEVASHKPGVLRKIKRTVKFKTGIIFLNSDMSEVGDALLDNHPELDILMMVAFPGMISWRTQKKDLPLPLGKIAKRATGDGGGHPMAAGSTISFEAFKDMLTRFMERNFNSKLDFSNLKSSWERKWEEEHKQQKQ